MDVRRLDRLHLWWVWRRDVVGFGLALLGLICIALVASPFAAVTNTHGKIVEFRKLGRKGGVEMYAVIQVGNQQPIVRLDATPDCPAGKVIFLQKRQTLLGAKYAAPIGCH